MIRALALALIIATPACACETALLLAIDVSGSIDQGEYILQTEGLATALEDPTIVDVLVEGQIALAVVQWSGLGHQALVLPWQRMLTQGAVRNFATRARNQPRAYESSNTAVGEAITFSVTQFSAVSDCRRRVIDISGDGPENTGNSVAVARQKAHENHIDINAIAIEDMGSATPISKFYRDQVITRNGFVITARGLEDYPRAIREKLLRELIKPIG